MVGEDDESSHEGGESEFLRFTAGQETEIKRAKDRVVAGGDQRRHVEDGADLGAAAEDMTLAAELAAVMVKGSYASRASVI